MTARDILYGRRGGGWADGPARELTPEAQAAADRLRREHAQHPLRPIVDGTEGQARMAEARLVAHGPAALSAVDVEALIRCPAPPGVAGLPRERPPVDLSFLGIDTAPPPAPVVGDELAESARDIDVDAVNDDLRRRMEEARAGRRSGELRRDDALGRVEEHADPEWKDAAKAALRRLAATREYLTGDDLWTLVPKPAEPRASGPLFRWAANEGLIAPTDRFVPTTQATSHASPSRVWKSLTYNGGQ